MIYTFSTWLFFFYFYCFFRLGLGDLLCLCIEGKVGQQRVYERTISADLWFWRGRRTDFYTAISNECGAGVSSGDDECDTARVLYRRGDGEDVSCAVLGLQQPAVESQRAYLCHFVAGMGRLLHDSHAVWAHAGGTVRAAHEWKSIGGDCICAHRLYIY